MKCSEATRTLSEAQERSLAPGELVPLEMHLALCPACRNYGDQLRFLREAVRNGYARQSEDGRDSSQ
jgi:predicted anti-sigma-YlaC factor YlaD